VAEHLESYINHKIVITGGLGFIGSNLAHRLIKMGDSQIILVDAMVPDCGGNYFNIHGIEDRLKVHIFDISDEDKTAELVRGAHYVFNLAGQVSHVDSMRDPHQDLRLNCASHISLLEACRKHCPEARIIYTSTRQVYGKAQYLPVDELHPLSPVDVNGINKLAAEQYHLLYNRVYGLRTVTLRLTNTYGPRQLVRHNRQGFIGWFIKQAIDGQEIKIFGDGKQRRDLSFVDDTVEAILLAGASEESEGQIFNLGAQEPICLLDLAQMLVEITGRGSVQLAPFPQERRAIDIGDFYCDYGKINRLLGWQPRTELRDGLSRTIEYYREYKEQYWS